MRDVSAANELACPDCRYLLRGLPGDEIMCPECGERHRRTDLLRLRQDDDDPVYLQLTTRIALAVVGSPFITVALLYMNRLIDEVVAVQMPATMWPIVLLATVVLLWWFIIRALPGEWGIAERWRLVLWTVLAHGGILVGAFGVVSGIVAVTALPFTLVASASGMLICLTFIMAGVGCIWLMYRGVQLDQTVRRRCRMRTQSAGLPAVG